MSKSVIAFSLWGENTRYTLGALQNASLAKLVYPGWICRFYVGTDTPVHIVSLLKEFDNVEICEMGESAPGGNAIGMFWRFAAASDPDIENLIIRDCDSRVWFREKTAVDEWLQSDKRFHIMRDHPYHGTSILGGMWGVRKGLLSNMVELLNSYDMGDYWQSDQEFLRDIIFPIVREDSLVHDSFFDKTTFPGERDSKHFVGQAYAGCGRILDATEYFQEFMRREYDAQKP